jgi:hypothetical protein
MDFKILFKLPSRTRPTNVFEVLDATLENLSNNPNFTFLLSLDYDDQTMNNDDVKSKLNSYPNMNYVFGNSKSKIDAVNRDLDNFDKDWDILVLLSDDMYPVTKNFDEIIRDKFLSYFPDLDGVTWFNDGYQKSNLNTLCILGKIYYNRFNYIYHPSYKSLWCDNEFTYVGKILNKQRYFDEIIIKHLKPGIVDKPYDELYIKNQKYENEDKLNFIKRKANNFYL